MPEFADALGKLGKGKMTDTPVKTQFGYHVIRVDDVRDAKAPEVPKFEDVKPQIKQQIEQQRLSKFQEDVRCFDSKKPLFKRLFCWRRHSGRHEIDQTSTGHGIQIRMDNADSKL